MKDTKSLGGIPYGEYAKHGLARENLLWMLRKMIEIRRFEEGVERLFLQEGARAVGICLSLSVGLNRGS